MMVLVNYKRMVLIMKKDVAISIKGISLNAQDRDVIEIFTTGEYYKKDGNYYIRYNETEATGFDGASTTLEIFENCVVLSRSKPAASQLVIERGVRHQCHYDTGAGDFMIGIMGSRIKSSLTDAGGNLELKYSMDINSMLTSENEMYIHVKELA